jgi:Ca-activated chloride channel family protein
MIEWLWPWFLLVLPLPVLFRWLLPARESGVGMVLKVPFLEELMTLPANVGVVQTGSPKLWFFAGVWLLMVLASMRPVWLGEPVEQGISGRDLMLAVDLSGSMEIEDFILNGSKVDRLTATQAIAGQFIDRRVGDRIGLILFGENAYLQAPLTFDRKTVHTLLTEAVIGLAGDKTAIGDAIGLAIKRLRDNPEGQRVLILLSDGANTAGVVSPLQAAQLAAREGLKIYTIGIGADEMVIRDLLGSHKVNPSADLDEPTMRGVAESTGGQYFRAKDTRELENIYHLLDKLEPVERDKRFYRPKTELYIWPLGLAVALMMIFGAFSLRQERG